MISRYARKEMSNIWTEQNQFKAWLDVELAACWAWAKINVIPMNEVDILYDKATFILIESKRSKKNTP